MTAYNVPPPWDPGYAMPDYAEAEGLERRAYHTKWMSRGTYDDPKVGTGGYAVPKYVLEEGIGQGAMVTKWLPRGTKPNIPHFLQQPQTRLLSAKASPGGGRAYDISLSGDDGAAVSYAPQRASDPFAEYGRRAARYLLVQVRRVPVEQRKAALKAVLDTLDPSLWQRAAAAAEKMKAQGAQAATALEVALASSMARGILEEVVEVGRTRQAPSTVSQLGLGCYGCAHALGAVTPVLLATAVSTTPTGSTRDRRGEPAPTHAPPPPRPADNAEKIVIGPFVFGVSGQQRITDHREILSPAWKDYFSTEAKRLTQIGASAFNTGYRAVAKASTYGLNKWLGLSPDALINPKLVDGTLPLVKSRHPRLNVDYGLYIQATPTEFTVWWREVKERSLLGSAWNAIKALAAVVVAGAEAAYDYARGALNALGSMACDLLNSGAATAAASAGAAAAGAPPQAGAAGVNIASNLCGKGETPAPIPDTPAPSSSGGGLGTIAIVGAGLAAVFLLTR
jgi:hypothetical protein